MPITNQADWDKCVAVNSDGGYGEACLRVARELMRLLEDAPDGFDASNLLDQADRNLDEGITGFMAGCIASIVSQVHSRGEEFRRSWNRETQIGTEGDRANETGGILNPALLNIRQS